MEAEDRGARQFASAWISAWRGARSQGLSAQEFFARHPEAKFRRSVVLGVAGEEFLYRYDRGELVERSEFCREFPVHQQSVARLLSVYEYLKRHALLSSPPMAIDSWPQIGETAAGYELLDELGCGAFARVFLAAEPAVANRRVAVKVSLEGAAEANILGKLSHPNIVPIYSVRQDERRGWTLICMPYRGQATLEDVIGLLFSTPERRPQRAGELLDAVKTANRGAEPTEAVDPDPRLAELSYVEGAAHWVAQLAEALAYAHVKGICHRDLKPSNVLIGPDGRPMLLDFNLSQDRAAVQRRLGGTLPYMAPEQLAATVLEPGPAPIDPRSDVFSLGVIAYELLCGQWTYGPILSGLAPDEFATELHERQRVGPLPLARLNPDVDAALSEIVQRCLAFDADLRPQTASQLASELKRCLSLRRRLLRKVRRHSELAAFAAGALTTFVVGTSCHFATREPYGVRELRAARAALENREFTAAVRRLDNASRFGVTSQARGALAETFYDVGKTAYERKDYDAARVHLTRAIDLGLNKWQAWFYRGAAGYRLEHWDEAAIDYAKAVLAGGGPEVDACQGDCFKHVIGQGYEGAKRCYLRAVEKGLRNAALFNNLGVLISTTPHRAGKQYEEAIQHLETAIQIDPDLSIARYNLAVARYQLALSRKETRADDATIAAAREAARRFPNDPGTLRYVAEICALGISSDHPRWQIAADHLWRAFGAGLTLAEAQNFAGLRALSQQVQSRPGFDELIRNQPKSPERLARQLDLLAAIGY